MKNQLREQFREQPWEDWRWQQQNSIISLDDLLRIFPNLPQESRNAFSQVSKGFRIGITPYLASLIKVDEEGNPLEGDPIAEQFLPLHDMPKGTTRDGYDGNSSNWELPEDFPTPILQHKYDNKAIFRMMNRCMGYCTFCFEAKRTMDKSSSVASETKKYWDESLVYLRAHPEIEEVILSGGEPLLVNNEVLERHLASLRRIPSIKAIRIHTRALTFNPYRIDGEFVEICKKHRVNELGIHVAHSHEITEEFKAALRRFDDGGYGSILKMAQIPLLKGVNDNVEKLHELFMTLYAECNIKPYYLFHDMPYSPGAARYRTGVREGVLLMNALKRRVSNVAMPEYIIVHHHGKRTVPSEVDGTPEFQYAKDEDGTPIVRFLNWKGDWETYLDGREERN